MPEDDRGIKERSINPKSKDKGIEIRARATWTDLNHAAVEGGPVALIARARARLTILQDSADPGSIACGRGCAHCCTVVVGISEAEAELIARFVKRSSIRGPLTKRLRDAYLAISEVTSFKELEARRGLVCPFLDGDPGQGICVIYEARPLACQSFTSPDVDICRRATQGSKEPNPARPDDVIVHGAAMRLLGGDSFELRGIVLEKVTGRPRRKLREDLLDGDDDQSAWERQ